MEYPEPLLLDEELENQCNEIRAIASKVCFGKIITLTNTFWEFACERVNLYGYNNIDIISTPVIHC